MELRRTIRESTDVVPVAGRAPAAIDCESTAPAITVGVTVNSVVHASESSVA